MGSRYGLLTLDRDPRGADQFHFECHANCLET